MRCGEVVFLGFPGKAYFSIVVALCFCLSLSLLPAQALEINSSNFIVDTITFLNGGGRTFTANYDAQWTAIGETMASPSNLLSSNFESIPRELVLLVPPESWELIKSIADLNAKTVVLGNIILEKIWQQCDSPYFYWRIQMEPPELVSDFSFSLDAEPDDTIDTTATYYQFAEQGIPSGKHTFFVLPFIGHNQPDKDSLLRFEIWVDVDPPVVNQLMPAANTLSADNFIPIGCFVDDKDSGLDISASSLILNDSSVAFNYVREQKKVFYKPSGPLLEGKNTVLIKAYDLVGNYTVKGWDFIVDAQPPEGNVLINAGKELTSSPYVSLNIRAQDMVSGLKNIYVSNDGVFDLELTRPYPYRPLISEWLLSEPDKDGKKTVYVKFEDLAGNISATFTDEINLMLLTPDTYIISGPASITDANSADFRYEATKPNCKFSYKLDNLEWSAWLSATQTQLSGLSEGNHYFYVKSGNDLNANGEISLDEEDSTPSQWVWNIKPGGYIERLRERILFWRR